MAKVKIEAISGSGTTWFYDLSNIPPLDDNRYVEQYNKTIANVKILWRYNMGPDTRWGIIHKIDGEEHCRKVTNGSETPAEAWRNIDISEMMIHVTDREPGDGLTQLDVYYYDSVKVDEGNPYLEVDLITIPITVSNPSLSNVTLSRDKPIILTWEHSGSPQYEYEIKYIHNGIETIKKVQSNAQSHTFTIGELPEGKITYQIRLSNGFEWSNWTPERTFTTFANKVISFEPDGVAQNKDYEITATWSSSEPYTKFEFEYSYGQGTNLITGTTESSYVFPDNFFGVETVGMRVRTYNGYMWSEWKTASFITYGKPETPALTIQNEYDTATPTFTWESTGQVSYRLQILKDEILVLDSADVYSSIKEHTFATALENNVVYTARLRIKNQYEYASDWDSKEFKIVFQELQKPRFDMFGDDNLGRVMFNIYNAEGQTDFAYCELYRREYGGTEWTKIATDLELNSMYTDYTCKSGILYEYKASAVSLTSGYTDSDIALKEVKLRNTMISDTTDYNNYVVLIHNPKKSRAFAKEIYAMQYSGLTAPKFEFGDVEYVSMNISFTVDGKTLDRLLDLYYSNNTLLLRDNRGKKIYGHISSEPNVEDAEFMKYTVNFPFTETNFNEGV